MRNILLGLATSLALTSAVSATSFTRTSPTGGLLPGAVTEVGGLVFDLKGLNGVRVVTQLAASSLYTGFANANPLLFGSQTGFAPIMPALGGGLLSASVRVTLYDGDSQPGNFDFNDNTLRIGTSFATGADFGNWSTVATQETSNDGLTLLGSGFGFGNNILSTGFFSTNNAGVLGTLYGELLTGSVNFYVNDVDPFDNFYDFKQGVEGSLINVGTGPVVVPGVPEPSTWAMMLVGFAGLGLAAQRRRRREAAAA
jgi:hypothetical protein